MRSAADKNVFCDAIVKMVGCAIGWHLGDAILWIQVAFKDSPRYEARRFAKSNNFTGVVIIQPDTAEPP